DSLHVVARDPGLVYRFTGRGREGSQVVIMRLRGVFRILALAVKRIVDHGGIQQAAFTVDYGNADIQGTKINSRHNGHGDQSPLRGLVPVYVPAKIAGAGFVDSR